MIELFCLTLLQRNLWSWPSCGCSHWDVGAVVSEGLPRALQVCTQHPWVLRTSRLLQVCDASVVHVSCC